MQLNTQSKLQMQSSYTLRKKLVPHKAFFCELHLTGSKERLLRADPSEVQALVEFLFMLFEGKLPISQTTFNFVSRKKLWKTLMQLHDSKSLKRTLKTPEDLVKFLPILSILLEVLF